jgi:ornithine decarboxylase
MVETITSEEFEEIIQIKYLVVQEKISNDKKTDDSLKLEVCNKEALVNFIKNKKDIEPFFIADLRSVVSQHEKWMINLPRFTPFYAIKSNNDSMILKTLLSLGTSFDCASQEEIKTILEMGVPPSKIIFANPCKAPAHIKFAEKKGVFKMTFDNEYELYKIKEYHPKAKLVIRILVDDSNSICQFGTKFGAHPGQTRELLVLAQKLELDVIGVSFHVGSGCMDAKAFYYAIKRAKDVFDEGKEIGFNFKLLDIGGGFPGLGAQNGFHIEFEDIAHQINKAIDMYFPKDNIELIAEPGRFYCSRAFTLAANITSKRTATINNESGPSKTNMYYINDGVYGSFNSLIFDHAIVSYPTFIVKDQNKGYSSVSNVDEFKSELHESSIWGPTCDSMDCLTKSIKLPDLSIGDWLIFDNMGAYTLVAASRFNGMNLPKVYYLNSQSNHAFLNPDFSPFFFTNQISIIKGYS